MRISIIGPSSSGKTTLAKKLSQERKIPHYNLDYIFFEPIPGKKDRRELTEKEWTVKLSKILSEKDWIIEGVNPIKEVFEKADKIIYLKPPVLKSLFRQWKRYFSDPVQRREHGFFNNLKLSRFLLRQYFKGEDLSSLNNPKHARLKNVEKILERYRSKVFSEI
jgi:adenylate kinase family enzyme